MQTDGSKLLSAVHALTAKVHDLICAEIDKDQSKISDDKNQGQSTKMKIRKSLAPRSDKVAWE